MKEAPENKQELKKIDIKKIKKENPDFKDYNDLYLINKRNCRKFYKTV